jgi:hypothetical protein
MTELPFESERALQAAAYLLEKNGGEMSLQRLLSLLYIAEREMLAEHGEPLFGGRYVATEDGPIPLDVLLNLPDQTA